jgi:hypothetical protein
MRFFLCLLLILIPVSTTARDYTVSGYVRVAGSGESVINCSVFETENKRGTSTNNFGFYSLTLPEGKTELKFSSVGFKSMAISIFLSTDTTINISLSESIELKELTVLADRRETGIRGSQLSAVEVPVHMIRSVPALLGETDLIKTLQMLPGVQGVPRVRPAFIPGVADPMKICSCSTVYLFTMQITWPDFSRFSMLML